jgi:hypothetical protein
MVLVVAASLADPCDVFAVPARRLARRSVIVAPPLGAEAVVVPVPGAGPAPVVVGPALRPRRRMLVQPGLLAVPGAVGVVAAPGASAPQNGAARQSTAAAAAAKPGTTTPVAAQPAATVPEQIPTPRAMAGQAPAGQPTVAGAAVVSTEPVAFTPAWYTKHPEAWRPAESSADLWKTADADTVIAWIGQPVSAAGGQADNAGPVSAAGGDAVAADGLRSVLVLPAGHQNGIGPTDSDWLPLGVFAVVPPGTEAIDQSHDYQQLAVDRQGMLKGNFYDMLSGTIQPIAGRVDRATLVASWTVGVNGSRFTAPMSAFAGQSRTVSVATGGQMRDLELMPVQKP